MAKRKKIFYPESQIKTGLYTTGTELMYADTLAEYTGAYHLYMSTGELFSLADWNKNISRELVPLRSIELKKFDNLRGDFLRSLKSYRSPKTIIAIPTKDDYSIGYYERYFTRRKNDKHAQIMEIDREQYDDLLSRTGSLDHILYGVLKLKWKLTGPISDKIGEHKHILIHGIIDTNRRTIVSKNLSMSGLINFLTDLSEFSKPN